MSNQKHLADLSTVINMLTDVNNGSVTHKTEVVGHKYSNDDFLFLIKKAGLNKIDVLSLSDGKSEYPNETLEYLTDEAKNRGIIKQE